MFRLVTWSGVGRWNSGLSQMIETQDFACERMALIYLWKHSEMYDMIVVVVNCAAANC